MRSFELHRDDDETGVSGTGVVAEGVEFVDGSVALRWRSEWPTSVVFHDRGIDAVRAVHGHGGKTRLVFAGDLTGDARDVLADRIEQWADTEDWKVYDYADRLIRDLDSAGFDIVRRDV